MSTTTTAPSGGSRPSHAAPSGLAAMVSRWRQYPALQRRTEATPMSAQSRLLTGGLLLLVLVIGGVAPLLGLHDIGTTATALFLLVGLGAAGCLWCGPMSASSFALYSVTGSLTASTGVGFAMAQSGVWYPKIAVSIGVLAAAVAIVASMRRDLAGMATRELSGWISRGIPSRPLPVVVGLSVLGLAGTVLAARQARGLPQEQGLLGTVGPLWFVAAAVLVLAFGAALWTKVSPALPVLAATGAVILSQAVMYGAPTVMAAARHIGLIQFIRTAGGLGNSSDIYQAWPGMFAGSAAVVDGAGISDPLTLATWWPVLLTAVSVLAVRVLAGRLMGSTRAWVAAAIFGLGDAVNSTYFSPQTLGFVLVMASIALVLAPPPGQGATARRIRLAAVVAMTLAVVISHQISPFMMGFALLALVLFRLVKPWWLPLIPVVPAVAWAAIHYDVLRRYIDLSALGSIFVNVAPPDHPNPVAGIAPVTRLAFYVPAAALVVLGIVALVVVFRRRDRLRFGLLATMASPVGLAFGTNYGQEGVFRVVLFAVPWLAVLVAGSIPRLSPRTGIALAAALAVLTGVNAYGQTGLDWARVMRTGDAAAVAFYERTAPDGATLLSMGTKNATPTRITARYDRIGYTSRDRLGGYPLQVGVPYSPEDDLATLTDAYVHANSKARYAIVSDAIGAYDDRYGLQRYSDFQRLEAAIAASPLWTPVFHSQSATVYRLAAEPATGRP